MIGRIHTVQSKAGSVKEYLSELTSERRKSLSIVRKLILDNLPKGYVETMQYGMISYVIPLERFPKTYNKLPLTLASLASQKNYMALYLMSVYGDKEQQFRKSYIATGKKLDMGKSCVRFKSLNDLPLELIGKTIARTSVDSFIKRYEKIYKK